MERIDIPKPVKGKDYIQRLAVQQNGLAIQYIPCPSQELCLMACEQNGLAIQFIDNPTDEMWEAAVNQNGMAIQFMNFVSDLDEIRSESESEEYTTPIFTDEPELKYPNLSDMSEVVNYLSKGGQLFDCEGNPIERGTVGEMIAKASEYLWKFPENGPQVENVLPNETNFAYPPNNFVANNFKAMGQEPIDFSSIRDRKHIEQVIRDKPLWELEEAEPLIQDRKQLNTVELGESIFPNNIKKPFTTSIHTGNCMGGRVDQDSDVYKFPTFDPTFNFSEYGPLAGNSVINGQPQFAYNPELPPVNYDSPFDTKKTMYKEIVGYCSNCFDKITPTPGTVCDNDCTTVICKCGKEYYYISDETRGNFWVEGHDPNCGDDSDDDIPELETDSASSTDSFTCI